MKIDFLRNLFILSTLFILCASRKMRHDFKEVICPSATIRSVQDFNQLQNCTVIAGYIRIVLVDFSSSDLLELKPAQIEEITEYLLVYRANGLDSLKRLLPKLVLIRGTNLLYDEYGLVIFENRDMENIGLVKLLRVFRGSIRIESNPSLCFVHTINWVMILGYETREHYYDLRNNKPPNQCPVCLEPEWTNYYLHDRKCWTLQDLQLASAIDVNRDEHCVKSNCLTSCENKNCRHCKGYVLWDNCTEKCMPPIYKIAYKRECVPSCMKRGLKQLGMECVEKCPKFYDELIINNINTCTLNCSGNIVIHSVEDLEGLSECTTIEGSLTIEIHRTDKPIVQDLENAFRNLNVITGYLKILNSPQIISLHFFKNLHTIRGLELLEKRYSLYIVNNDYLQELFPENVAIVYGCIYFHLNPRLCSEKITDLQKNLKQCDKITIVDVSPNSNGERVVCGQDVRASNATIIDVNSNSAVVQVDVLSSGELLLLVGYIYYYKEAPYKNVTKYDGRHGCGWDGWFTDVALTKHRRHIIKNLKAGTQYAYFVNSMTVTDYPYSAEHVSEIQYFKTLPDKPEMVAKLYAYTLSKRQLEVHWWPPRVTNGVVEKYILQYEITNATVPYETAMERKTEFCPCPQLDAESIIPTPHVENFYNKEQLLYRDSVMNFIFVKKPKSSSGKTKRNATNFELELRARYNLIREKMEKEAFMTQDEEKEAYVIPHPPPVCNQSNPSIQQQMENKCVSLEKFENAVVISGTSHNTLLYDLEPENTYRISVRACVKGLENGCGAARTILAETVSTRLEKIIESLGVNN